MSRMSASATRPSSTESWASQGAGHRPHKRAALALALVALFVGSSVAAFLIVPAPAAARPMPSALAVPQLSALGFPTSAATPPAGFEVGTRSVALAVNGQPTFPAALPGDLASTNALARAAFLAGASGAPMAPAGPHAASTATNTYISSYSTESSVTQIGSSSQDLEAAANNIGDLYNFSSGWFYGHGIASVSRSTNGGSTFFTNYLGRNASWTNSASTSWGDVLWGDPTLSSSPSGTLLLGDLFLQPCFAFGTATLNCTNPTPTVNLTAPMGVAVVRSTNSGASWGLPVVVFQAAPTWYLNWVQGTTNCPSGHYYPPANETDKPWVAFNGANGHAYAGWTLFQDIWGKPYCASTTGGYVLTANLSTAILIQVSVSTNSGLTWSAPVTIGRGSSVDAGLAVGPAPTYRVYGIYSDFTNSTATTFPIDFFDSSNNGTSWSAPSDIGSPTFQANYVNSSAPAAFRAGTIPAIAVDNWSGSPHSGNLYIVWSDNRTSTTPGYPSVAFTRSTDNGSLWSTPVYVSTDNPGSTRYFQPTVTVRPNGEVWVLYYGVDIASGTYRLYGTFSSDGGVTFSPQFVVSDTDGIPGQTVTFIGDYTTAVGTSAGTYATWTDCRALNCPGTSFGDGNTSIFGALLEPVALSSSSPGVAATVTTLSRSTTFPLPNSTAFIPNAAVSASVPTWAPFNASYVNTFQSWSGATTSTNNPVSFTYTTGSTLVANYNAVPAGWIAGSLGPTVAGLTLSVAGYPIALTTHYNASAWAFNFTVPGGASYAVVAGATGYSPFSQSVPTADFQTQTLHIWLGRLTGNISGSVFPATATVTVNGTAVTVQANGRFLTSEPFGSYYVNASATGYVPYSRFVAVAAGGTVSLTIALEGAWVNGTVNPATATVTIGGQNVNVTFGSFSFYSAGGTYEVRATHSGYSVFDQNVTVAPGHTQSLTIALTNRGWIVGNVAPGTATVFVNGQPEASPNGQFNISELAGTYNVSARLLGYVTNYTIVTVNPGLASPVALTLTKASTGCGTNCPQNNTTPPTSPSTSGLSPYIYVAIIVVVLVAVAAAVLLMRRRGQGQAPAEAPPESPTAGAEAYEPGAQDSGETPPPG